MEALGRLAIGVSDESRVRDGRRRWWRSRDEHELGNANCGRHR
jgi:hypothetical protein